MGEQRLAYILFPLSIIGYPRQITDFAPTNGHTIAISHLFPVVSRFKGARSNTPVAIGAFIFSVQHRHQIIDLKVQLMSNRDIAASGHVSSLPRRRKL